MTWLDVAKKKTREIIEMLDLDARTCPVCKAVREKKDLLCPEECPAMAMCFEFEDMVLRSRTMFTKHLRSLKRLIRERDHGGEVEVKEETQKSEQEQKDEYYGELSLDEGVEWPW